MDLGRTESTYQLAELEKSLYKFNSISRVTIPMPQSLSREISILVTWTGKVALSPQGPEIVINVKTYSMSYVIIT